MIILLSKLCNCLDSLYICRLEWCLTNLVSNYLTLSVSYCVFQNMSTDNTIYIHCNQLTYCYELFSMIFSTVFLHDKKNWRNIYNLNLDSLLNFTLAYGRHDDGVSYLKERGLINEKKRYIKHLDLKYFWFIWQI